MRPLVAITRQVPEGAWGAAEVDGAEVKIAPAERMSREELLDFVRGSTAVVTMFHDRVDDEFLDAAGPRLKGVCNYGMGYDNVDVPACAKRGVIVANTPDVVTEGTANMAMALLLAAARRIGEGDRFVRAGGLEQAGGMGMADFLGVHLSGATLLIVGAGRIGRGVAMRAVGFGLKILYVARSRHADFEEPPIRAERVELDEGLARADFVSIHLPLTDQTRRLIDARRLSLMKPTAVLVNTGRGAVVDEAALVSALRDGKLFAAGLDVFEDEPRVHPGLVELDNVVMTPHVGSAERRWRERQTRIACDNAAAIIAGGRPPNLVTP